MFSRSCIILRRLSTLKQNPPEINRVKLNDDFLKWVSSVLSNPSFDSHQYDQILTKLSPFEFDHVFNELRLSSKSQVNPKSVLGFFYYGSQSRGYKFRVSSYCGLVRLLVGSDLISPARQLLVRLVNGNLAAIFDNNDDISRRHIEIANLFVDLNVGIDNDVGIRSFDMLIHVYCTDVKNAGAGFELGLDVFKVLAKRGAFPSLRTCNFLLSSLVKANELQKSYKVFEIMRQIGHPESSRENTL